MKSGSSFMRTVGNISQRMFQNKVLDFSTKMITHLRGDGREYVNLIKYVVFITRYQLLLHSNQTNPLALVHGPKTKALTSILSLPTAFSGVLGSTKAV
jgi:hypothetical protein